MQKISMRINSEELTINEAFQSYISKCKIRNLSSQTIKCYNEHYAIFSRYIGVDSKVYCLITIILFIIVKLLSGIFITVTIFPLIFFSVILSYVFIFSLIYSTTLINTCIEISKISSDTIDNEMIVNNTKMEMNMELDHHILNVMLPIILGGKDKEKFLTDLEDYINKIERDDRKKYLLKKLIKENYYKD